LGLPVPGEFNKQAESGPKEERVGPKLRPIYSTTEQREGGGGYNRVVSSFKPSLYYTSTVGAKLSSSGAP